MSLRCAEILTEQGFLSSLKGNCIPSGRQLPRTPPLSQVKKHLDFSEDDLDVGSEEPRDAEAGGRDADDRDLSGTFECSTPRTRGNGAEADEPSSMLKGMKGYQLTPGDLEFIQRLKEEKLVKQYLGALEDVQRQLKKETMALEFDLALRKKAEAELCEFPSCEELVEWMKVVLQIVAPSTDVTDLDAKSLLAMVTTEDVRAVIDVKKLQMEDMAVNKRKKHAERRGRREKQMAREQLKLQGLMSHLCDLTAALAQQEDIYRTLQIQLKGQEDIGVDAEKVDASEEPQGKGPAQRGGKERKRGSKSTEKVPGTTKQNNKVKLSRSKRVEDKAQNAVEDAHSVGGMRGTQKKPKPEAATVKTEKSVKASRGSQKKDEQQESGSHDGRAVRGRRKAPATTQAAAGRPEGQCEAKAKRKDTRNAVAMAAEEAQTAGLRRSRRIASRR